MVATSNWPSSIGITDITHIMHSAHAHGHGHGVMVMMSLIRYVSYNILSTDRYVLRLEEYGFNDKQTNWIKYTVCVCPSVAFGIFGTKTDRRIC